MQTLHQLRGGEADDKVDQAGEEQQLDEPAVAVAYLVGGAEEVGKADHVHQRRILEQDDRLREQERRHVAEGLRQHDQAHRLARRETERKPRPHLALRNALDAGADDLRVVGCFEQREGHQRRGQPDVADVVAEERAQALRHDQVEPQDDHHQRNRAEQIDVAGGELRNHRIAAQSGDGEHRAPYDADDDGGDRHLQRDEQAFGKEGDGPGDGTPVHFVHGHLPPTKPGTRTFSSRRRIRNITVTLISRYITVTAMNAS